MVSTSTFIFFYSEYRATIIDGPSETFKLICKSDRPETVPGVEPSFVVVHKERVYSVELR